MGTKIYPPLVTYIPSANQTNLNHNQQQNKHPLKAETRLTPRNADTWLLRAETAPSQQEAFLCMCRVFLLDPLHPVARKRMYELLQPVLNQDAFLTYIDEEDHFYRVHISDGQPVIVPKDYVASASYPLLKPTPLQGVYRWVGWTVVGLLFSGLGALILAPMTLLRIVWVQHHHVLNDADRARAVVMVYITAVLWLLALILSGLFFMHI